MKTIKQKAKAYDEALERAKKMYNSTYHPTVGPSGVCYNNADLEILFPELRESEDERIRNEIIYHIQNCDDTIDEETEKRMIAWLEKQ